MKNRNTTLGLLILSVGIIWLLFSFDIIDWRVFESLRDLWPLILVVIGINFLFRNNSIVRIIAWLAFTAIIILYGLFFYEHQPRFIREMGDYTVNYEKTNEVRSAVLDADLGGYKFDIRSTDDALIKAIFGGSKVEHSINHRNAGREFNIRLRDRKFLFSGGSNRSCDLYLNNDVEWELDFDIGAFSGSFDLRDIKLRKLDIDSGAGNMDLFLGANTPVTEVEIDAGATSVDVLLPAHAGVKIEFDGGVSKSNLSSLGWNKTGKYYVSPNYDEAENKIIIDVDMGVGRFNVTIDDSINDSGDELTDDVVEESF